MYLCSSDDFRGNTIVEDSMQEECQGCTLVNVDGFLVGKSVGLCSEYDGNSGHQPKLALDKAEEAGVFLMQVGYQFICSESS